MTNMRWLRNYQDMSETVIDNNKTREYFENLDIYRLTVTIMTSPDIKKSVYFQDYSQILLKNLRTVG